MNATEQLAYQWLKEHGANEESIIFQRHKSPDFITSIGKFEVKRTQGRYIQITRDQTLIMEKDEVSFLVYVDKSDQPLKLSPSDLKEQFTISVEGTSHRMKGQILLKLEGQLQKKFEVLKKHYGVEHNSEVFRLLVGDKFKQLFPKES